jgi:resuscitation-promoting factor RpfA
LAPANRVPVSDIRKFAVAGLVVAGVFLLCCGAGMSNVAVGGAGVLMAVAAPVLIMVTSARRNYVYGTARVIEVPLAPIGGTTNRAEMQLVVNAQGIDGVSVRVRDPAIPVNRWPQVGALLPVEVVAGNPRKLRVLWDDVRTHQQAGDDDYGYTESAYSETTYSSRTPTDPNPNPALDPDIDYDFETVPPPDDTPTMTDLPPVEADDGAVGGEPTSPRPASPVALVDRPKRRPSPRPRRAPREEREEQLERDDDQEREAREDEAPAEAPVSPAVATPADTAEAASPVQEENPPLDEETETPPEPQAEPADDPETAAALDAEQAIEQERRTPNVVHMVIRPSEIITPDGEVLEGGLGPADVEREIFRPSPYVSDIYEPPAEPATEIYEPQDTPEWPEPHGEPAAATAAPPEDVDNRPRHLADGEETDDAADELEEEFPLGAVAKFTSPTPRRKPQQPPLNGVNGVSVTLIVSDLQRSRRFYRDTLGLQELDSSGSTAVLASGEARVVLRRVADMPPVDRRVVHLNLEVPDVYEAYERLKGEGVEFVHRPRVVPQGEQLELVQATFRDPDGHAIALTRWELRR